jgi:hypothetical protein
MAKQCNKALEDSKIDKASWLRRLGRYDYKVKRSRSSLPSHASPASVTEASRVDSQIVQQQGKANTKTRKREVASETFPQGDLADFVMSQ